MNDTETIQANDSSNAARVSGLRRLGRAELGARALALVAAIGTLGCQNAWSLVWELGERDGAGASHGGSTPPAPEPSSLREAAERSGRLIGAAVAWSRLPEYGELAAREFNYVTAENEMKWSSLQPQPGQFNFTRADEIVEFAEQHGMQVKGHTLIWYRQLPGWVSALTTAEEVRAAMLDHIDTVVSHFRGRVRAWDVVNEAWEFSGGTLRNLVFRRLLGDDYIDEAFHAARAADPDAKLYYNDFGGEGLSPKADDIYTMVQGMLERGVPIDGVGLQLHVWNPDAGPSRAELEQNMQRLADLGLDVVLSEVDVSSCMGDTQELRLAAQRDRYFNLTAACVAQPACSAITVWGITDRYSWLNNVASADVGCAEGQPPMGLLFDDDYLAKPAYDGVMAALLGYPTPAP